MDGSNLSLLVIGAGAVGGITAAILKKNGINVEVLCKSDDYASLVSERGIDVSGVCGEIKVKITAYSSVSDIKEKKDIIILATKANDVLEAARTALPVLKKDGYMISLQNGICIDNIVSVLGKNKVIGCITGWGATMEFPGKLIMTSMGDFIIGYPEKNKDDLLISVANILSSVVPVKTTDNIMGHLYSKLIINSCITSLGAICGLYLGKMLSIPKIRKIFIEIIWEAMYVADNLKVNVEVFGGKLDFRKFQKGTGVLSGFRNHLLLIIIGYKYRRLKSSSLQSLERGKPTEIDYLNGYIVKNAINIGLNVPVNVHIVNLIHEIEQKKRDISIRNFDHPFFDRFN